jgi:hypothetical protein
MDPDAFRLSVRVSRLWPIPTRTTTRFGCTHVPLKASQWRVSLLSSGSPHHSTAASDTPCSAIVSGVFRRYFCQGVFSTLVCLRPIGNVWNAYGTPTMAASFRRLTSIYEETSKRSFRLVFQERAGLHHCYPTRPC